MNFSELIFFLFCGLQKCLLSAIETDITKHSNWKLLEHEKCGISNADRIIGGKNASMGMYPWIARIGYSGTQPELADEISYRCGGSLINKFYVVTAAHCVSNLPSRFKVAGIRIGEHNTDTNPDCEHGYCADKVQDFSPASIITHEKYNLPPFKHDIALIRLNQPVVYNENVMPICMPTNDLLKKNFTGEIAEVAGWGIYNIHDPKSSVILQTIKLPMVETEKCAKAFLKHARVGDEQLCVGGKIGEDSCGGDSGGPLMKVESVGGPPKYYFIGLVSFGAKNCGQSTTPAVYTRMSTYMDWILNNIKE